MIVRCSNPIYQAIVLLVCLLGEANYVHSLSPRAQIRYLGSRPSESISLAAKQQEIRGGKANAPGSDLFPGKGPYVPLGLSVEEYQKIKEDEKEALAKKNFGAWGPRFKQGDAPQGDWMVMPSLWTNGVNPDARPEPPTEDEDDDGVKANLKKRQRQIMLATTRLGSGLKRNAPGFLLGYIALDILATAIAMWRTSTLTVRQCIWMISKLCLFFKRNAPFYVATMLKMQAVKVVVASLLAPWMSRYLEAVNRRKLWSRRRTILTTSAAGLVGLSVWGVLLLLISRVQ